MASNEPGGSGNQPALIEKSRPRKKEVEKDSSEYFDRKAKVMMGADASQIIQKPTKEIKVSPVILNGRLIEIEEQDRVKEVLTAIRNYCFKKMNKGIQKDSKNRKDKQQDEKPEENNNGDEEDWRSKHF